jgi:hypothetical protein
LVRVDERTQLYTCTCPDHQYRSRDCKHIRSVQAGAVKPRLRVTAEARPALADALSDLYGDGGAAIERALAGRRNA